MSAASEEQPTGAQPPRAGAGSEAAAAARPSRKRPSIKTLLIVAAAVALLAAAAVPAVTIVLPWWNDANAAPARARVAAGRSHTCAISADRTVKCWGANAAGQLGDGTTSPKGAPVAVRDLTGAVAVAAGGDHSCALTAAGAVLCWGDNAAGQLGDGSTDNRATPVPVRGLTSGVLAITAGMTHTCALRGDRTVTCWGDNGSGQLGTGDTTASAVPVAARGLPGRITAVSAGSGYTCVVAAGRTLLCWGDNSDGQLGLGDLTPRLTGEPVIGLPRTSLVSAGDVHACALTQDGLVMCWGSNQSGQLGTTMAATNASAPLAVPGLSGRFQSVAAGYDRTCALAASGEVTCWGGEPTQASPDPSQARPVTPLTGVSGLAVGAFHACADTGSGVYCWGRNDSGQLGAPADGDVPVAVPGV